jgi:ribonuclease-3
MLRKFESEINYSFKNRDLLKRSLTHKSSEVIENNEKLEFLGDRVLGLVISKKIYLLYPTEKEGDLDKRFAFLVNKKTCLKIGQKLKLNQYLILGNSYKKKIKIEDKIIADACESLIGAIYLDGGFILVEKFILKLWSNEIKKTFKTQIDPKTKLQEYSLKVYKKLPVYKTLKSFGPKHNLTYKVGVKIENSDQFIGIGKSIKNAQQSAAKKLIKDIGI